MVRELLHPSKRFQFGKASSRLLLLQRKRHHNHPGSVKRKYRFPPQQRRQHRQHRQRRHRRRRHSCVALESPQESNLKQELFSSGIGTLPLYICSFSLRLFFLTFLFRSPCVLSLPFCFSLHWIFLSLFVLSLVPYILSLVLSVPLFFFLSLHLFFPSLYLSFSPFLFLSPFLTSVQVKKVLSDSFLVSVWCFLLPLRFPGLASHGRKEKTNLTFFLNSDKNGAARNGRRENLPSEK